LNSILENEVDYKVLVSVTSSCLYFKHPLVKDALLKFIQRDDIGYMSHGNALFALGAQYFETQESAEEMCEILIKHIANDKKLMFRNYVTIGAYKGLAKLSSYISKSHQYLFERALIEHGESLQVLLSYLGDSASRRDEKTQKETINLLSDFLRNDNNSVKKYAISGLKSLQAKSELSQIIMSKQLFAHQYRFQIQDSIDKISKSKPDILTDYQKPLEEMNKRATKIQYSQK
jgi:hypothetical protein